MNVILLESVYKLGDPGDMVKVRPGYARNYLVPEGLAVPATRANRAELDAMLNLRARRLSELKADAERLSELLGDANVQVAVRAGDGRIYGSVGNRDIARILEEKYEVEIDRRKIELREPIKTLGEFQVPYRPHPEVEITLNIEVVSED
ncbi:MAG TPA: 50S ribosomal protein L9 [Deinococcales bacterium]|nr:50S ribosomal protein L9 [Deinococcales bacterium]